LSEGDLLSFRFRGREYLYHRTRKTKYNERAVELPIVKRGFVLTEARYDQ